MRALTYRLGSKRGFTLLELSLVLVIVGLVAAGIVIGQHLIRASEIRAAATQLGKFSSAVNTFRSKYSGIPGDLKNPGAFGFDAGRLPGFGGNAAIESAGGTSGTFEQETSCFWDDLTFSRLISEDLNQDASCEQAQTPSVLDRAVPQSRLGRSNYILIGAVGGVNYFWMTGVNNITAGVYDLADSLSAEDALSIDAKLDDSVPTQGTVQAYTGSGADLFSTADSAQAAADGVCLVSSGYNFITGDGGNISCQLRIFTQF